MIVSENLLLSVTKCISLYLPSGELTAVIALVSVCLKRDQVLKLLTCTLLWPAAHLCCGGEEIWCSQGHYEGEPWVVNLRSYASVCRLFFNHIKLYYIQQIQLLCHSLQERTRSQRVPTMSVGFCECLRLWLRTLPTPLKELTGRNEAVLLKTR